MHNVLEDGEDLFAQNISDHQAVKEKLQDLWNTKSFDSKMIKVADEVVEDLKEHAQKEETDIFPRLKERLSETQLSAMQMALKSARAVAPTRPHPNAPVTAPWNWVSGPIQGVVDKLRDAYGK
jgi:hemerythrin superfamily protein